MKKLMSTMLVCMILALGSARATNPCMSYSDCGQSASGNYGCPLGSWMGVTSYSNGGWTGGGCGEWQCVEFVKRFYSNEVGDAIENSWGSAKNAYDVGDPGLNKYAQGSTTSPQPGDILCFDGGTYGHVAIVTEVGTNYVRMMDQNRTSSSSNIDIVLTLTKSNDNYTVGSFGSPYYVEGWMRDPDYIPSDVVAKFTDVVNRNGSSAVGNHSSNFYWYGPYVRRNYTGGTFGTCCIMYDPNNARGNPQATNEAYLIRTGFYSYYTNNGGWEAKGCPSRDEYHPETGAQYDAIQFFVRRLWNFQLGKYDNIFHYMYYQHSGNVFSWHSSYTCGWVSQTPPSSFAMERDSTRIFTVQFRNTGTTTWYSNAGSYPYDYVCLKSTDPNGSAATSLLYASGLGWIDSETPCTMQEASVAPGNVATFTFTGKVASTQAYGLMDIYFRPQHSMAGLLDGWGGMHYPITVIDATSFAGLTLTPIAGDWNQDGSFEVGVYADETRTFYLDTNNDGYTDLELAYSGCIDEPLAGNWDNSGGYTVGFYRPPDRVFWLDYQNDGEMDASLTFGNSGDLPLAGDWQGIGPTRIGLYRPSTRTFWLDFNNDGAADASATFGDAGDLPLTGDWDGDVDWTIGLYRPSTRTFWLDNNNDGAADFSRTFGDAGDMPVVGDWTGNGGTNIGVFRPSTKYFWLDWDSDGYPDRGFQLRRTVPGTPKFANPGEETSLPLAFTLHQNYPNPFNPATTIAYTLPTATHVTLDVFNILGQRVVTLVDEPQEAGEHTAMWEANPFASGVYFYRIRMGETTETKKMLLLK